MENQNFDMFLQIEKEKVFGLFNRQYFFEHTLYVDNFHCNGEFEVFQRA